MSLDGACDFDKSTRAFFNEHIKQILIMDEVDGMSGGCGFGHPCLCTVHVLSLWCAEER